VRTAAIPAPMPVGPFSSKRLLSLASDDKLVDHLRRGNEAAFSVAFERHAPGLLGFCRHMLGSPEEAEDAVQHTFATAFRDLTRPDEREVALKSWLYAIARNRCLSVLRARREEAALDFDLPTEGLTKQVERRAALRDLLRDLRELPEDQRAALLLSEAGGLSHAEVAGVLGCAVQNVKALVFRARTGLIQRRDARETPCADIREQLANLRGSSLRRNGLRHHLRSCAGCRSYRDQVDRQRHLLRSALPVAPTIELKSGALAAAGLGSGSAGGGVIAGVGAGLSASLGTSSLVQVVAVGALLGGGAASLKAVLDQADRPPVPSTRTALQGTAPSRSESGASSGARQPIRGDLQPGDSRAVEGGADPGVPDHRAGAAPSLPGRIDDDRSLGGDQNNANRVPLAGGNPPTLSERGHDGPAADMGAESPGRGPTSKPTAGIQGQGGKPADIPVRGSPPSTAPDRGGKPSSAPDRGGPPSSAPDRGGPPSSAPDRGGKPSSAPDRGGPPSSAPDRGGPPSSAPDRGGKPSSAPDRGGPPSSAPDGGGKPSSAPDRGGKPSSAPDRGGPPSSAPDGGGKPSSAPDRGGKPSSAPDRGGPPSSAPDRGGPPSSAPDGGGKPSSAPDRGGKPSSAPDRGGPPSSARDRGGKPSSGPARGGPPSSTPAERSPAAASPVQTSPPAPKPSAERPSNQTEPASPPGATREPAPVSQQAPTPSPAEQAKAPRN
jgi:RNA polymerase sigma factor (sigma-70 family)